MRERPAVASCLSSLAYSDGDDTRAVPPEDVAHSAVEIWAPIDAEVRAQMGNFSRGLDLQQHLVVSRKVTEQSRELLHSPHVLIQVIAAREAQPDNCRHRWRRLIRHFVGADIFGDNLDAVIP